MQSSKTSAVKLGLFFGLLMGLFGGLLGLCLFPALGCLLLQDNMILGLILGILVDVIAAVGFGAACGLVYGLIMGVFIKKKEEEFVQIRDSFIAEKRLIYNGPANHRMGKEWVGGWLFLLNDTLYFKSHKQNIQVHELEIPLANIRKVECTKKLMNNNGLNVELLDGTVEQYVVNDQKIWAQKIYECRDRILQNQQNA